MKRNASLCLLLATLVSAGCVERRLTVRSEPPGALVVLDGQEIGHTPVSVPFDYYGDREIKLVRDGFETRTVRQRIDAPWWQLPGIDFFAEIAPWHIRDERQVGPHDVYTLSPLRMVPTEELLGRAEDLRAAGQNPPPDVLDQAGMTGN